LTKETGVIVGASNDKTGNIKFGGDWIMESTSQNIELIYFTKSIEYYSYLLDNIPIWATTGNFPQYNAIYNGYLYVTNAGDNTIGKISLTNPSVDNNQSWVTTGNFTNGIAIYNGYLYVANGNINTIGKISLTNPSIDNNQYWATTDIFPTGIAIYNGYLYVANAGANTIGKISLTNPSVDNNQSWVTTVNYIVNITIYNGYLYLSYFFINTIGKISLTDPINDNNPSWAITGIGPGGLAIYNEYLYLSNFFINTIGKISLTDPINDNNQSWAIAGIGPAGLAIYNEYLYVANAYDNTISRLDLPYIPPIVSDICFPAGTPIKTDQGIIAIEKIKPNFHTINKKQIVEITKTISPDNFLVEIKKNALGHNYPIHNTTMSQHHKVFFQGKMREANVFLEKFKAIKVKYTGEILYNVLMEDYWYMSVNNLICETLHPDNVVAKLYTKKEKNTDEIHDKIVVLLKEQRQTKFNKANNKYSSLSKFKYI
jgi:hypothetical protein